MHTAVSQKQKLVIHMNNSPIHKSKITIRKIASMQVKLAPRPSYSQDLAPSDFFLFGYIKQKIAGQKFVSPDDLLEAIREEFDRFSKSVLESLFDEWMIRLQTCLDYKGSHFPEG
jgi:transposase